MPLTVLNVAYPFAPVGPGAVGGAEQVLMHLDAALTRAGHRSLVIACEGSAVRGTLLPMPKVNGSLDAAARRRAQTRHRDAVVRAAERRRVDVVHLHGVDFHTYLPPPGTPALVTLHLPLGRYPQHIFDLDGSYTHLHCVSTAQRRAGPPEAAALPVIENGVPLGDARTRHATRRFVMALGRICPEKGFHHAQDAASRAGLPCLLAGAVYPYPAHEQYFRQEIAPRIESGPHRYIGAVTGDRKRRMLSAARALLVPSRAAETSSLVAMEALAEGTPVVAFPAGALPDLVEDGTTGFLVEDAQEMAAAIAAAEDLDPNTCRRTARERFSLKRMTDQYLAVYAKLARLDGGMEEGRNGGGEERRNGSAEAAKKTRVNA